MFRTISEIGEAAKSQSTKKKLVLAAAHDQQALSAALDAGQTGYVEPILIGKGDKIRSLAQELGYQIDKLQLIDVNENNDAVEKSVKMISSGDAHILMKGACGTAELLKGVLNKEWGLRSGSLLSHFALFEIKNYHKLLSVSDVAISIAPGLKEKIQILNNGVKFLHNIGICIPKVAIIAALEKVTDSMPATLDAAEIVQMYENNLIHDCIVDGPLALDNAISTESAKTKGISSKVAGDADLLIMPQIESGNVLYKALTFLSDAKVAAVVLGASAPIVLTSRADSHASKLNSIMLAAIQGIKPQ